MLDFIMKIQHTGFARISALFAHAAAILGMTASRAAADFPCGTYVESSARVCPKSMLYPLQGVTEKCIEHVKRTIAACDKEAATGKNAMEKHDKDSKEYAAAKAYREKTIASMDTLLRGFPLETLYVNRDYRKQVEGLKRENPAGPGGPIPAPNVPASAEPNKIPDAKLPSDTLTGGDKEASAAVEEAARQHALSLHAQEAEQEKKKDQEGKDRAGKIEDRLRGKIDQSKNAAENWEGGDSGDGGGGGDQAGKDRAGGGMPSAGGVQTPARVGGSIKSMGSGGRSLGGDIANPKTGQDLMLASMSGYKGAFAAAGMKMGRGADGEPQVLRSDGTPASASEIEALTGLIGSEPQALQKRPDFFSVIPRDNYNSLKETYREKSDAKAFKHVGLPDRRDFEWSRSCEKVSGNCNEYTSQNSYRKGEYVSPEDLWSISEVMGGAQGTDASGDKTDQAREKLSRGPYASLMKNVLGALGSIMKAVRDGGSSSSSSSGSTVNAGGNSWFSGRGARQPVELSDPALVKRSTSTVPGAIEKLPPSPRRESPAWPWLLAAAAAAGAAYLFIKRRSTASSAEPPDKEADVS